MAKIDAAQIEQWQHEPWFHEAMHRCCERYAVYAETTKSGVFGGQTPAQWRAEAIGWTGRATP